MNRRQHSLCALLTAKCLERKKEGDALKDKGESQHYIIPGWVMRLRWMRQVRHAFVDRHPAAERENQDCYHQRPEVEFFTMAERMMLVRRLPAHAHTEQQQSP